MYVLYFLPIFVVYLKMSVCLGYPCILTSSFLHSFLFFHNSHIISNKLFDVVISKWRRSEQSFSVENDKIKTSLDLNPALVNWCQSKRLKTAASRAQGAAVECSAMFWLLINWEKKLKTRCGTIPLHGSILQRSKTLTKPLTRPQKNLI